MPLRFGTDIPSVGAQPSSRRGRLLVFAAPQSKPLFALRGAQGALGAVPAARSQCHQADARHYGASRLLEVLSPLYYLYILLNLTALTCTSDSNTCLGEASHTCLKF